MQELRDPAASERDMDPSFVPSALDTLLLTFRPCFTKPSFANFVALVIGWIVCPGERTISRVIQAGVAISSPGKHHSALYRFLSRARWAADDLGEVIVGLLMRYLGQEVLVIVDDTLNRRSGPHIFAGGMHRDPCRSPYRLGLVRRLSYVFGHQWVVLAVWVPVPWKSDGGIAVPVLFRLCRPKKRCPASEYRKRTELALDLIRIFASWLPPDRRLHIVSDTEYACSTVVRSLTSDQVLTGPMNMDAALFTPAGRYRGIGRPRLRGDRLPSPRELARKRSVPWKKLRVTLYGRRVSILVKVQRCLWWTVARDRPVRVVLVRDPRGRMADRAYFCTDSRRAVTKILKTFARRWQLEVTFRDAKQSMGAEDPRNGWWRRQRGTKAPRRKKAGPNPRGRRGETAICHTFPIAFTAYAIVVLWYLRCGRPKHDVARALKSAPWHRHKTAPSFEDMLAAIRRSLWKHRLSVTPATERSRENVIDLLPPCLLAA